MSALALTVNGVLRRVSGGAPIPNGRDLYYAFAPIFQLILLADHQDEQDELTYWLEIEGLQDHAMIVYPDVVACELELPERRVAEVTYCSSQRYDIAMVVDPDPEAAHALYMNGYTTLLYSHQDYAVPSWRPDYDGTPYTGEPDYTGTPKPQLAIPWNELSRAVAHNARLRELDKRRQKTDAE